MAHLLRGPWSRVAEPPPPPRRSGATVWQQNNHQPPPKYHLQHLDPHTPVYEGTTRARQQYLDYETNWVVPLGGGNMLLSYYATLEIVPRFSQEPFLEQEVAGICMLYLEGSGTRLCWRGRDHEVGDQNGATKSQDLSNTHHARLE